MGKKLLFATKDGYAILPYTAYGIFAVDKINKRQRLLVGGFENEAAAEQHFRANLSGAASSRTKTVPKVHTVIRGD